MSGFNVIEGDVTIRNGADAVDVKPASAAPAAADKALVVALSPNGNQLTESTFTGRVGEVQTTPTTNTVLGRLKDLYDRFIAQLPAALVGGRLDTNTGSWLGSTAPTVGQKLAASSVPVILASDQPPLQIGVGPDLDNGLFFSATVEAAMASGGVSNPLMLIRNPLGSGKTIYIFHIYAGTSVVNIAAVFRTFASPTVTANGTAVAAASRNVGGPVVTPVALVTSLPTVSAQGSRLASMALGQNNNSVIFAEDFSVAIQPGGALLVTGDPISNNRQAIITVAWKEK